MICWIAYLIYLGAIFGSNKPGGTTLYASGAYGINIPLLCNVMKRDAYRFMRRFIHFCDNDKQKDNKAKGYDPLFKVTYALDEIAKGIRRA